ncbi:cubilin-like isoform X4 [Varroa destructor]|uniref:CUB domain-containing protein n=1 Tax=Varroa destructor TaxID=109461 RepID=A0A7M7IXJ5_VARDE|nr:cubilin-like isoform X4 [Varroa destructor]
MITTLLDYQRRRRTTITMRTATVGSIQGNFWPHTMTSCDTLTNCSVLLILTTAFRCLAAQQTEAYTDFSRPHAFPTNIVDNKTQAALQAGFVPSRFIPQGVCDYCLEEGSGNLTSNNYPLKYPANHDCIFRIKKAHKNVCAVRLTFHDFDVEHSAQCRKDKLIVDGVNYCGDAWKGNTKIVQFWKRDEVRLNFVTDNSGAGRGFWIEAEPVSCVDGRATGGRAFQPHECEEVFRNKEFTIQTDDDCTYYIRKAPHSGACGIQFRVANIGMNCDHDYLSIDGGRDKLCYSKTVPFDGDLMVLSTKGHPGRGKIRVRQTNDCPLAPPPLCDICTERISDDLTSYGYAVSQYYRNNLLCKVTISRPSNMFCSVKMFFKDFDVEESLKCDKDFLLIGDQRHCGNELYGQSRVLEYNNEGNVELVFRSDGQNSGRGFHLRFQQLACTSLSNQPTPKVHRCTQTFMSREFTIQSPGFPQSHPDNSECKYTVIRAGPDICYLELSYDSFNLEESIDCSRNYLEIGGEKHCGSLPSDHMHVIPFVEGGKIIRFHSGDKGSPNQGFSIQVRQLGCGSRRIGTSPIGRKLDGSACNNGTPFIAITFEIESPGYPEAYGNSQDCVFTIQKNNPNVCRLQVTFADFSLPASDTCQGDHLSVDDLRVCGAVVPGTIRVFDMKEDTKKIEFHSDDKTTDRGFRLLIKQVECSQSRDAAGEKTSTREPVQCDRVYATRDAIITSVGYPNSYENNLNCVYTIRKAAASVCRLELVFQKFDVESSTDCEYDYLQVGAEKLCGVFTQNTSGIYEFDEPEKALKFHSDAANSRPGFQIKMRQIDCGRQEEEGSGGFEDFTDTPAVSSVVPRRCDKVFTSKLFDLRSVDYPSGYPGNLDCKYIIFQANSNVCRLEFTFIDFDMEANCEADFLEIDGERLCGNLLADTKKVIPFRSAQKIVRLHTDPVSTRSGFHIKVKQVECPSSVSDKTGSGFDFNRPWKPGSNDGPGSNWTFDGIDWNRPDHTDHRPGHREDTPDFPHIPADRGTGHHGDGSHVLDHSSSPCKYEFSEHSGVFYSQNFPGPYPNRMSCTYKIFAKPGHCSVELNFVQFRLDEMGAIHPSETCDHDYMELNGIKYCHRQLEGQIRALEFDGHPPHVEMKFFTDEEAHGKGFLGFYRQMACRGGPGAGPGRPVIHTDLSPDSIRSHQADSGGHHGEKRQPSCDRLYALAEFSVESPGHPGPYLGGLDCKYFVRRLSPDICSLAVSFQTFNLAESPGCFFDYLEIDGEKICGHVAPGTIRMVPLKDFQTGFVFHSNQGAPQGSRQGFILNVRQVPCGGNPQLGGGGLYPQHPYGGSFPHDPPTLTRTDVGPPLPPLDRGSTSYPPPHEVHHGSGGYAGSGGYGGALGSYGRYGPMRPLSGPTDFYGPSYSPGRYHPGAGMPTRPGSYPQGGGVGQHGSTGHGPHGPHGTGPTPPGKGQCDQMVHEPYFEIKSNEFVGNHIDCRFTIYQQNRNSDMCLEVLFLRFEINCEFDQMRIDDHQLCGTIPPNTVKQYKFHDFMRPLYLYFHSSAGAKASDYIIRGRQSTCDENSTGFQQPGGTPTRHAEDRTDPYYPQRPNYPGRPYDRPAQHPYDRPEDRPYNRPQNRPYDRPYGRPYDRPGDRPSGDHPYDRPQDRPYNRPLDAPSQRHPNCDATFSGLEFKITSPGFPNPYSVGKETPLPPSPLCDYCQRETHGQFASPNYPSSYGANARCSYRIEPVDGYCHVEIYWHDFDLESSPACHKDMVALDGSYYCANDLKKKSSIFDFPSVRHSEIKIMLQSDAYVEGRGFHLEYRQLRCKNSTNMVPEALTLRKGLQEQTVKTALFISGKNGKTDSTSSSNNATTMVNANATELSAKHGRKAGSFEREGRNLNSTKSLKTQTAPSSSTIETEEHSYAPAWTKFAKPTPIWR